MDPKEVREWRARYEAVNRITLEEARKLTPAERFKRLKKRIDDYAEAGMLEPIDPNEDLESHLRWSAIQEKMLANGS